ncbi:PSTVd RNA-binding protein Virp1d [Platysternon megacephalum]|uniref:PSTVd RNA-binding protein Virp1d n=1 Tax=Platysternon megacephalum TaxID=55544 RepID=A0A4D9DIV9_9SAUR|nr:PSTVd RNA-binding protein Virp1d [Platysternon megacephalum]
MSSESSASSLTITRSYRSLGGAGGGSSGGLGENLVTRSYILGNSNPRTQVSAREERPLSLGQGNPKPSLHSRLMDLAHRKVPMGIPAGGTPS